MVARKKIGYLGPEGTYTHEMAMQIFPTEELISYLSMERALEAANEGEVDEAVVPIENSTEGAVLVSMDVLAHEVELEIIEEHCLPIEHSLWVLPSESGEVTQILSHPQALGQCRKFLKVNYPEAQIVSVASSAGAAEEVAKGLPGVAAIASSAAGERNGLKLLHRGIQNNPNNCTRFVRARKEPLVLPRKGMLKSSFVCKINGEKAGSLQELLREFSSRGINLTRIESRPTGQKMGEYYFFIDIVDSADSDQWQEALGKIAGQSLWYKKLGTYPEWKGEI